jgi:hypothetical protein
MMTVLYYTGAAAIEDCLPCPGGHYCEQEGQLGPTGECSAGYYCPANDTTIASNPTGFMCPVGYYCHQGNSDKKTNNTIKIIYHQGNSHKKGKIAKI